MKARGRKISLPPGSRIMETGGFKGRARVVVSRRTLPAIRDAFDLGDEAIISEYGMTELTSQYYAWDRRGIPCAAVVRAHRVVGRDRTTLAVGEIGSSFT